MRSSMQSLAVLDSTLLFCLRPVSSCQYLGTLWWQTGCICHLDLPDDLRAELGDAASDGITT